MIVCAGHAASTAKSALASRNSSNSFPQMYAQTMTFIILLCDRNTNTSRATASVWSWSQKNCLHGAAEPSAQVRAANGSAGGSAQRRRGAPPRHRHSTPSDGDEVAAAVDQKRNNSVSTADPEVFFRGDRWQSKPPEPQPPERPSVEITAVSPPPSLTRTPSDRLNTCISILHAFQSDHLKPSPTRWKMLTLNQRLKF